MKEIKMMGEFGSTLFQKCELEYSSCNEGISVVCPNNGYFCVRDMSSNEMTDYHQKAVICEKKKLFKKNNSGPFKIYFISNGFVRCKGYTPKMIFDVSYDNVSTEVNISYDYDIKVAPGRHKNFIDFIETNNIGNASYGEVYQKKLNDEVSKIVKEVIGNELRTNSATEVEDSSMTISASIKDKLNSTDSILYNYGIIVINYSFNIQESYMHREEKKRFEKNQVLKKVR